VVRRDLKNQNNSAPLELILLLQLTCRISQPTSSEVDRSKGDRDVTIAMLPLIELMLL
jgi:hypothetical protein